MNRIVILFAMLICGAGFTPARADPTCFSVEDSREQVKRFSLVALHDVVRSTRDDSQSDLISARLCETNGNMVYMIILLGRSGKVMRVTIDARTGTLVNHR